MSEEKLKILKDTGCVFVGFGVESGSPTILESANKHTSPEKNLEIVNMCKRVGLTVKGFFVVGLPGETYETLNETYNWLKKAQLDDVDINIFYPYPGTEIGENIHSYDVKLEDSDLRNSFMKGRPGQYRAAVSTSALTSKDLEEWRDMLYKEFKGKAARTQR